MTSSAALITVPSPPLIDYDALAGAGGEVSREDSSIKARGLDCHVGSYAVDLAAVRATKTPDAGPTYQPIGHGHLYDRVRLELEFADIHITEELHALYRGGERYIGLAVTDLRSTDDDADVVVGWFNSHDHSHAATLLLGDRVTVCFNLCLHAEIKVCRRHTKHIKRDLPGLVAGAVDRIRPRVEEHGRRTERYRATALVERDAHHLVVRLVDEGALNPASLRPVLREWREPSHEEFAEAWNVNRLYQAVTGQQTSLAQMARRHTVLHGVLDGWCSERGDRGSRVEEIREMVRTLRQGPLNGG